MLLFLIFSLALACLVLVKFFDLLQVFFNVFLKYPLSEDGFLELQCQTRKVSNFLEYSTFPSFRVAIQI